MKIEEELTEAEVLSEMGDLSFGILNSNSGDYDRQVRRLAKLVHEYVHRERESVARAPVVSLDAINATRAKMSLQPIRVAVVGDTQYPIDPRYEAPILPGTMLAIDPESGFVAPAPSGTEPRRQAGFTTRATL